MNIVQIQYTKYHSSGDKAQINIYLYIYDVHDIAKKRRRRRKKQNTKDTVQTTTKNI
jgi:hypothetical protein